jgi:hypothetical protein
VSVPPAASCDIAALLERVADRTALDGHDGRSGAHLERGSLDGRRVIVKTVDPDGDLSLLLGGDPSGRERRLWADGVLDRLPAGTGHALIAADWTGGRLVTVMRDLGAAVLSWDRRITPAELHRLFDGLAGVHRAFADQPPAGLCDLATRLTLFAPDRLGPLAERFDLIAAVRDGWERFAELVPAAVADAVFGTLRDPARLVATLGTAPPTLCHGDAWLVNIALTDDEVVLLDWALATCGPASLDLVAFTVGCASHVDLPRDAVLAAAREACRPLVDDPVWDATVFWALCELGWNKALDATTHTDPVQRAAAADELDWWVAHADAALSRSSAAPG